MMAGPAFVFNAKDFLVGTAALSLEEIGHRFTAICNAVSTGDKTFFDGERPSYVGRIYWRRSKRPHIPTPIRRAVFRRDGFACVICGATERLELDHIHPFRLGGADTEDNLRVLCKPCNLRRR
jgi:hypothetical protein